MTLPAPPADPGLFAPLTRRETILLGARLRPGWIALRALWAADPAAAADMQALLRDLRTAWLTATPGNQVTP